ncbi:uncharacterized protein [Ciconia boyciana]|uniref:uncharacterized protein n=1 Tax=Ciconia boyciana TaxID=52775 RepID=UPI003B9EC552
MDGLLTGQHAEADLHQGLGRTLALSPPDPTAMPRLTSQRRGGAEPFPPSAPALPGNFFAERGCRGSRGRRYRDPSRGAVPLPLFAKSKQPGVAWACACPLAPPAPTAPVTPVRSHTRTAARGDARRSPFSSPSPQLPLLISEPPRPGTAPTRAQEPEGEAEVWGPPRALPLRALPGGRRRDAAPRSSKSRGGFEDHRCHSRGPRREWGPASGVPRVGRAAAGLPQRRAACRLPARAGWPPRGREGCGSPLSARRPETRPRRGGAGGAPAVSPLPQGGGEPALRLAPLPASAPDPPVTSFSPPAPPAALRVSAAVSRAGPAARPPPARGDPHPPAGTRSAPPGASRVGGGMCVGGGGGVFSSQQPFVLPVRNTAVWEQVRVPAGCGAPLCAPAVPGRGGKKRGDGRPQPGAGGGGSPPRLPNYFPPDKKK